MGNAAESLEIGILLLLDYEWEQVVAKVAAERNRVDASNTRGAGSNSWFHERGVLGEALIRRKLGLAPPRALLTWDADADIPEATPPIEVKFGLPMEAKSKLCSDCCYIVVNHYEYQDRRVPRVYTITHMAMGSRIRQYGKEPPEKWCPRKGTARLNWMIP